MGTIWMDVSVCAWNECPIYYCQTWAVGLWDGYWSYKLYICGPYFWEFFNLYIKTLKFISYTGLVIQYGPQVMCMDVCMWCNSWTLFNAGPSANGCPLESHSPVKTTERWWRTCLTAIKIFTRGLLHTFQDAVCSRHCYWIWSCISCDTLNSTNTGPIDWSTRLLSMLSENSLLSVIKWSDVKKSELTLLYVRRADSW